MATRMTEEEAGDNFSELLSEELRQRNEDKDPDQVYRDVKAVVDEVRRERYEREHPTG